jgi:hypothetical protein
MQRWTTLSCSLVFVLLWSGDEQMLPLNIEGMYQHVQMHRRGN